ncbi:MAG: ribonuclease P protein component [Gammaproteobacteria bacterium]
MRQSYNLRESADFQQVFKQNESLRDRNWLILYSSNELEFARLGLAVSKKNVKKASQRNRIKRIIRETFRKKKATIKPSDIVVLARHGISEKSNRELIESINSLWYRIES